VKKYISTAVLLLVLISVSGCDEDILHDLSEMRANQVLLVLERAQISAEKVRSGKEWVIRVPKAQALQALSTIEESRILVRDLERHKEQSGGLMQSREDRELANERELSWDLETTLERIPGVREAKVHLSIESDSPLAKVKAKTLSSASVLLVIVQEDPLLSEKVKQLVSGAAGLPPTQVSVVMTKMEEPMRRALVPTTKLPPAFLPVLGSGLGALFALFLGFSFIRRIRRRRPKTISMLSDSPLRPQSSFPDPVQRRDGMEIQ